MYQLHLFPDNVRTKSVNRKRSANTRSAFNLYFERLRPEVGAQAAKVQLESNDAAKRDHQLPRTSHSHSVFDRPVIGSQFRNSVRYERTENVNLVEFRER
ncbi:hypothetical protein GWI33_009801 [Rhynchophorus ferrugineus]|uniref:Uncharacterized protein n=1 Tax=Rhynchophorus ferrugineus TaxID=354439 RepID=A0A834MKM0_RHYFE|nr:hypothetical protein GWI33_009801 [Rhynchophorus ferrugineus]